jgi:hypothetical protein
MARIVNFYEVSPEEKNYIVDNYTSTTSELQVPDYPEWKDPKWQKMMFNIPEEWDISKKNIYDQYMNRSKFTIRANRGKIRCAVYIKPCNIYIGDRPVFKQYIVLTNESKKDIHVDKYTELGLLMYGYDPFTTLSATIHPSVI